MSPKIVLDDWRQAQLFLKGGQLGSAIRANVTFVMSSTSCDVIIIPSTKLLERAKTQPAPQAYLSSYLKKFLKLYKNGLVDSLSQLGFDAILDLAASCYAVHEIGGDGEPEIKFQCSYEQFWYYYKCRHSLGLSIRDKGVTIPDVYNITNITSEKRRGRPKKAKRRGALEVDS